ncbi:MAG TPA: 16S rRNA (adenine(1518)-N(6)/adenine(1519)-N(6))-dimethyltransferase RsmA [Dehalococcoidales bacterium]
MQTESLLTRTKKLLKAYDLHARKGLAQHFLVDGGVVKQILAAAELSPSDTIIEVGPGLGVLTGELVKSAGKVIAIELDQRLAGLLKGKMASPDNLAVINDNVLKTDPAQLLTPLGVSDYKVVANLPYYITGAVIRHFLEASLKPRLMVLMVQREVAKQITAKPGEMSLLSVSVQFYGVPKIAAKVPAHAFYPTPKVDSAVLRIDVYPQPKVAVNNVDEFFRLVKAGFSANRKQLINSLSHGLDLPKTEVLLFLEKAGIDPKRRAETLTIGEWGQLLNILRERGAHDNH